MTKKQVLDAALGSVKKWEGMAFESQLGNHKQCPFCILMDNHQHSCKPCPGGIVRLCTTLGPYGRWLSADKTQEAATVVYLSLLAIYFELVHNWEGYKNSVREVG